jgi:hypothetical protein
LPHHVACGNSPNPVIVPIEHFDNNYHHPRSQYNNSKWQHLVLEKGKNPSFDFGYEIPRNVLLIKNL